MSTQHKPVNSGLYKRSAQSRKLLDFELPKGWYVIGPLGEDYRPAENRLTTTTIPEFIESGGRKLVPKKIHVDNGWFDLAPLLGGTAVGRSALVYIPFTTDGDRTITFGFGADWWFEAYLDGAWIYDTLENGNGNSLPTTRDHVKTAHLSNGPHMLVIRFISGSLSSVLCVRGSDSFKRKAVSAVRSALFTPLRINSKQAWTLDKALEHSPMEIRPFIRHLEENGGESVLWGIPFAANKIIRLNDAPVTVSLNKIKTRWLVFLHTSEELPLKYDKSGFVNSSKGRGQLGEPAANYVIKYADGTESKQAIRQRYEIGMTVHLIDAGIGCVPYGKPYTLPAHQEQMSKIQHWGWSQTRVAGAQGRVWLYAWENPCPEKPLAAIRLEPLSVPVFVIGITAGKVMSHPLRWEPRKKAVFTLPGHEAFNFELDDKGLLEQIQLDLGQVISVLPRQQYDQDAWIKPGGTVQAKTTGEILIEYTAHPEAHFHLFDGTAIPVAAVKANKAAKYLRPVAEAKQLVKIRVVEKQSRRCVPVRLHIHGEAGEYLAPVDRHRIPNPQWFEDYSPDYVQGAHFSTYIAGETTILLPAGKVYIEVSKGFEIRPVRKVVNVNPATKTIVIELEKILPWREKGWVTADTHVHFLSPQTALLEGEAEGVNVVNLLASQWGELMTNVGDFDGKTTFGSREGGGSGEYMVRVGTENRQGILGHISLLGYEGPIIAPMTTGGPGESALGDPVFATLTEWAEQCKKQKGVVVIPHFSSGRLENAAVIASGNADGIELCRSISPYALSDWYRYLNCGYLTAAVGGTDKMAAWQAVGNIRTYAYLGNGNAFTYKSWKEAVRRGATFVTTGPLMEFLVEGKMPGTRIRMKTTGGTVSVTWNVASVTAPMSRVDLVSNGEIIHTAAVKPASGNGNWEVKISRSAWLALLVRDGKDQIVAHSSPVMIDVEGSPFFAAADAMTILEQIEGTLAYIDTIGTRAEIKRFKAMKMKLISIHRALHNRMHRMGKYHHHTAVDKHPGH